MNKEKREKKASKLKENRKKTIHYNVAPANDNEGAIEGVGGYGNNKEHPAA